MTIYPGTTKWQYTYLLLMGISYVKGYCNLPWIGEQYFQPWFVRYSGTTEFQKYFYNDRKTIKEGITAVEPSGTFRCTTWYLAGSGKTFFTYEHNTTSTAYCNSGLVGQAKRGILYSEIELPSSESGTVAFQCMAVLSNIPNDNVLIKGSLSTLTQEGGSCPLYFTGKLHLKFDAGDGVQCSQDIYSTAHLQGGRLVLNGCSGTASRELPVHDTFICVDSWIIDASQTNSNRNLLLLAKETDPGVFSFHCVIYRSYGTDIEMSIAPANELGSGPTCPKNVPYNKAGEGYTYVSLKEYEFCAKDGEYVRDDENRNYCFYKQCKGQNDERKVACPPGSAVSEDFIKSTSIPCTEKSNICSRCDFVEEFKENGTVWLSGVKNGQTAVTAYSDNFVKTYLLSDPSSFDEYSCLDTDLKDTIQPYHIRYKFLDATHLKCVHDQIFSSNNQKYILHQEIDVKNGENAAECKVLVIPQVELYYIYMSHPLPQDKLCPFPTGTFQVTYSFDSANQNKCLSNRESLAVITTSTISLNTCAEYDTYDFPLKSTLQCVGQFSATALGDDEGNGNIVLLKRTDSSEIIYCARYQVSGSTTEISMNVNTLDQIECSKKVHYQTFGNEEQFRYRYLKISSLPPSSSIVPRSSTIKFESSTPRMSTIRGTTPTTKQRTSTITVPPSRLPPKSSTLQTSTLRSSSFGISLTTVKTAVSSNVPASERPTFSSVKISTKEPTSPTFKTIKTDSQPTPTPSTTTTTTTTTTTRPTTTTTVTTTTGRPKIESSPDAYHIQVKFINDYASHVANLDGLGRVRYAEFLVPQVALRGRVSSLRIPVIRVRKYPISDDDNITASVLLDFDVNPTVGSRPRNDVNSIDGSRRRKRADVEVSAQGAARAYLDQINVNDNFSLSDQQERVLSSVKNSGYAWRDYDPCPNVTCAPNGRCVVYQGDYFCACNVGHEGTHCEMALATGAVFEDMTTYIIVGAILAILIVLLIVGVVCFRHAYCGKERKYEDTSSTQELDPDDDQSVFSKRATAYHNTAFSTSSESGTLRSITGLGKGHGSGQEEKEVATIKYA